MAYRHSTLCIACTMRHAYRPNISSFQSSWDHMSISLHISIYMCISYNNRTKSQDNRFLEREDARTTPARATQRVHDDSSNEQSNTTSQLAQLMHSRQSNSHTNQLGSDTETSRVLSQRAARSIRGKVEQTALFQTRGQLHQDTSDHDGEACSS